MELYIDFITARRRSLRRLCFYACLSVHGGGVLSQHALQVVSQHALQQVFRGGGIPACLAGFQAHPGGKFRGVWPVGGSPGQQPRGKLKGIWPGGSPGPQPRGQVEGDLARGGRSPGSHQGGGRGGGACSRGSAPAGGCGDPPSRLLLRTVRILLECILV